jgi:hypothetical protein
MHAPERFGDMAIPADRPVRPKDLRKLFRPYILPFGGLQILSEQGRWVIPLMQRREGFATENALLSLVPLCNDVPNQTILRVDLNLVQTILTAVLALGPAGASLQPERGLVKECAEPSFTRGHINRFRLTRFRTGHQMLASKLQVRTKAGNGAQHKKARGQYQDRNDDSENGV